VSVCCYDQVIDDARIVLQSFLLYKEESLMFDKK
jgi:hypothetical protein